AMTLTTHGTEYFRDPELVRRALQGVKVHEVDGTKFDVFAAGAVLYSMVEDSFPAHGVLSQISRRCPEAIKWVIRRAMTEYDKRYVSADAMLADLQFVAMAKDPFAVKPFELPSMRGGFAAAGDDVDHGADAAVRAAAAAVAAAGAAVAGAAAAGSSPGVPPPIPGVGRRVPRIKVTNWWNGQIEVEGHDQVAGHAVAAAAASEVSPNGATAPFPQGAVPPPIPVAPAAGRMPRRPLLDPSMRQAASAQLDSARNRVEAARARIKARFDGRGAPQHFQTNPTKGGVALALCVFLGAVIGVAVLVGSEKNEASQSDTVVVDESLASTHSGPAWDEAAVFAESSEPAAPALPAAPQPPAMAAQVSGAAEVAPKVLAELVVINDLKQPWSESNRLQLEQLAGRLQKAGVTLLGESPMRGADASDRDVTIAATLRMALGQSPHDSSDAKARALKWLEANGGLGGVLWVTPSPSDAAGEPTLTLIKGQIEDWPWKAVRRALEAGRAQ
ncbi:MAG: hypothetical protein NTV94_14430, partial [Planctomycetota bacterium]|nr:hypothetical protein [Planctomycetota bacterium]